MGILSAWMQPCIGYESNIYAETPALFWIGLMVCYFCGIGFTVFATFRRFTSFGEKYLGYSLLILASTALICLHIIRGYKLINISGDTGTHLGVLREMLVSFVLPNTYYPNVYLEPWFLSIVTGLDVSTILMYLPIVCIGVMTFSVSVISRRIYQKRGEIYFSTLLSLLLPSGCAVIAGMYHLYYVGQTISQIALIPIYLLLLVLFFSKVRVSLVPLILVAISILFYHPVISVVSMILSIVFLVVSLVCSIQKMCVDIKVIFGFLGLFLVQVTSFVMYQWDRFGWTIIAGFSSLLDGLSQHSSTTLSSSPSQMVGETLSPIVNNDVNIGSTVEEIIAESNVNGQGKYGADFLTDTLEGSLSFIDKAFDYGYSIDTIFQIAGINILVYGLFFLTGLIILIKYFKSSEYFFLKVFYIIASAVVIVTIVASVGDFIGGYTRFTYILYILALISSGFVLYRIFSIFTNSGKKITTTRLGIIVVLLMLICSLSVISFHPSPHTLQGGYQEPHTEYIGIETFYPYMVNCDYKTTKAVHFSAMQRHIVAIFGPSESEYDGTSRNDMPPYHFGYNRGIDSVSELYDDQTYIIMNKRDEEYYDAYFPHMKEIRWTDSDYAHFGFDNGVNRVYSNDGLRISIVKD